MTLPNWKTESGRAELPRQIAALAQDGLSRPEIAMQLGVTIPTVSRHLREAGITPADRGLPRNPKLTEADVRTIRDDRRRGVSTKELAIRYGVTDRTIQLIVSGESWRHLPHDTSKRCSGVSLAGECRWPAMVNSRFCKFHQQQAEKEGGA